MSKRAVAPIVHGRIRLRLLEEDDLPLTREWRNQDHIRCWFFKSDPISEDQHRAWFERYRQRDDDFVFIVEETDTMCRPVGQVALYNVEWDARRAEFGRLMIGEPAASGQGLGMLATSVMTSYGLDTWGFREIYLVVRETNARAIAIYQQCGYVVTARSAGSLQMTRTAP